jgi:hypothetical protein
MHGRADGDPEDVSNNQPCADTSTAFPPLMR